MAPGRPAFYRPAALAVLLLLPAGATHADRSSKIDQVVKAETLAERSAASLEQIVPASPGARGRVDQIDPASRPISEPVSGDGALTGTRQAKRGCEVSEDQAVVIESLRAQGQIVVDDCMLVDWVAITGGKSSDEERRDRAESVSATLPELLSFELQRVREENEALEKERLEAARAAAAVVATEGYR